MVWGEDHSRTAAYIDFDVGDWNVAMILVEAVGSHTNGALFVVGFGQEVGIIRKSTCRQKDQCMEYYTAL